MQPSERLNELSESSTLLAYQKAMKMKNEGKRIFNLTAGQLPFMPMQNFKDLIKTQTEELASFQYSPVAGFESLRKKVVAHIQKTRAVPLIDTDCIIGNGAKQIVYEAIMTLVNPGDEVIVFAPYWVSYSEMVKLAGGVLKVIDSDAGSGFLPSLEAFDSAVTSKTKLVIFNSPNNPSGVIYPKGWVRAFSDILMKYPQVYLMSDEIYFELRYGELKPEYPYQYRMELLSRTIIVDGISKSLAATGLRIGYGIAKKEIISEMTKLQGHLTSGASSLTQLALGGLEFNAIPPYMKPINEHLAHNSALVKKLLQEAGHTDLVYAAQGAFYYLLDISKTPLALKLMSESKKSDISVLYCDTVLVETGLALVPGIEFGAPNTVRFSLVLPKEEFHEAMQLLVAFLRK